MPRKTIPHFVQIDPPGRKPGICWIASLYLDDGGDMTSPVAIAWISNWPAELGQSLDMITVPDHWRRQGYAKQIIRECEKRFPGLWLTEPISPAGEKLAEAVEREEPAESTDIDIVNI